LAFAWCSSICPASITARLSGRIMGKEAPGGGMPITTAVGETQTPYRAPWSRVGEQLVVHHACAECVKPVRTLDAQLLYLAPDPERLRRGTVSLMSGIAG
jgi:hypothetical protein